MAKNFDPEQLKKILLASAQNTVGQTTKAVPTEEPVLKTQSIIEYQGRLSVTAMEKFNGPAFVAGTSLYLNDQDKAKHKAVGAFIVYFEVSNAEKLLKAFGYSVSDDEEDEGLLNACTKFCESSLQSFIKELTKAGYPELVSSNVVSEKNSLTDGLEFSSNLTEKQEISYIYWKKKTLAMDVILAPLNSGR